MVKFSEAAHLTLKGLPQDVNQRSPLEDQVAYVWQAMRQYAASNNWDGFRYGGKPGHKGSFTMSYFIKQLFPGIAEDDRHVTQQIVSKVLRQTGAAVCIYKPSATELQSGTKPTWFVSDEMPDNLIVVATHHKPGPTPGPPDRLTQVANKLTPQEAGEDREPAPVETRQMTQDTPAPSLAEQDMIVNGRFIEELFEEIATCPVPITVPELVKLTNRPAWACRHAANQLELAGRLVWRYETRAEKLVRGGGKMPPAKHSRLYWPAPGPVPERTELPPGIDPVKSSSDHVQERMAQRAADDRRVLEYLQDNRNKHRTSGRISEYVELPLDRTKNALDRLTNAGKIRRNSGGSYYVGAAESPRRVATPEEPKPASVEPPPPSLPETLTEQIHRLVDQLAETDTVTENRLLRAQIATLNQRIQDLRSENDELLAKIAKIRGSLD